jgi:hypothetical protein
MEHEITAHTRKIYKAARNPAFSFWKKTREILVEVFIIVFAVSLAAFLERQREHSNEQHAVKLFLTGLKTDLENDITEMDEDKKSFIGSGRGFSYITSIKPGEKPLPDSMTRYQPYLLNTTRLIANNGRYEGFKSSGKVINIENQELQNDILDLYQENIPALLATSDAYTRKKENFFQVLYDNLKRTPDGRTNMIEILMSDKAQNVCLFLVDASQIVSRYDAVIQKSRKIIAEIDKEYK